MIAQRGIEDIVQYCSLSEEDRSDLLRYFERTEISILNKR